MLTNRILLIVSLLFVSLITSSCATSHSTKPHQQSKSQSLYPTKPKLVKLENGYYRLLADWRVQVGGRTFILQKGYSCNGITAPKRIKSMLGDGVDAPETWSAVFHDWCFTQPNLTRHEADTYFVKLMKAYRINSTKISLIETAVRGYTLFKK